MTHFLDFIDHHFSTNSDLAYHFLSYNGIVIFGYLFLSALGF